MKSPSRPSSSGFRQNAALALSRKHGLDLRINLLHKLTTTTLIKEGARRDFRYHLGAPAQAMWADSSSAHSDGGSPDKPSDKEGELSHKPSSSTDKPSSYEDKARDAVDSSAKTLGSHEWLSSQEHNRTMVPHEQPKVGPLPSVPPSFTGTEEDWRRLAERTGEARASRRLKSSDSLAEAIVDAARVHSLSTQEAALLTGKHERYVKQVIAQLVKEERLTPTEAHLTHPQQRYFATDPKQNTLPCES